MPQPPGPYAPPFHVEQFQRQPEPRERIIERPVYIETPFPVPFERPFPVPVPQDMYSQPSEVMMRRMAGFPENDFPYHNPYTDIGAGFYNNKLEASNEPDPLRSFLERMKPFS
jgi:hypothetical protein